MIRIDNPFTWRSHNGVVINLQWQETFHTVWLSGHWGSCGYRSRPMEPDNPNQRRRIMLWRFCNVTFGSSRGLKMRMILILLVLLALPGCETISAMSESEKQTAMWVIGFVATAAVISNNNGDSTTIITNECQKPGNQVCD